MLRDVSLKTIAIILVCMILVSAGVVAFFGVKANIEKNAASNTSITTTITAKTTTKTTSKTTSTTSTTSTKPQSIEAVLISKKFVNTRQSNQYFTFTKNGKCVETNKGVEYTGKWKIDGVNLIIHDDKLDKDFTYTLILDSTGTLSAFSLNADTFQAE